MTLKKMAENDDYDSIDDDEHITVSLKKAASADEDTDDASETDRAKQEEATEIKEQMYREKLALIKQQESQLESETMPEFARKQKKLEQIYKERQKQIQAYHSFLLHKIEKEFKKDQEAAFEEFERKKVELKENLLVEIQQKKKQIETEKHSLELTSSSFMSLHMETKATRTLRRRPNEPAPIPNEKRRKPSPTQLSFVLTDEEIMDDLKMLNNGKDSKPMVEENSENNVAPNRHVECRLDHGKVFYDKRWYHTGQPVFLEYHKEGTRISGVLSAITEREIWVQKVSDGSKLRIFASQLHRGKCSIKKRTT